jgi:beta-galactosidase
VLSKQAGIEAEIVGPEVDFSQYKLLILPSVRGAFAFKRSQWDRMLDFVRQGGALYLSYDGCSLPQMEELFGFAVDYRWQNLAQKHALSLSAGEERLSYLGSLNAALKLRPRGASVLGKDEQGEPVLLQNQYGEGKSVFCGLPVERLLGNCGTEFIADRTFSIYRDLKELAGIDSLIEVDSAFVERVVHTLGEKKLVILVNHNPKDVNVEVLVNRLCEKRLTVLNSGKVYELAPVDYMVRLSIPGNDGLVCLLE